MGKNKDLSKKGDQPSKIALFSTLLNISVAGTKGLLAWLSGSSALLADKVVLHYEPVNKDFLICPIPVEEDKHTLSDYFGETPYFYLLRMDTQEPVIQEKRIFTNPYRKEEKDKGIKASEWLLQNGVDVVYTRKAFDGKGSSYVFSDADVEVMITEGKTIDGIRQKLRVPEIN